MINHHKKNLEDKNPNNNYKKKKIYLKICDKFCITYRGIYHLKKDSKKFYKYLLRTKYMVLNMKVIKKKRIKIYFKIIIIISEKI